jgi:hypothetical protein
VLCCVVLGCVLFLLRASTTSLQHKTLSWSKTKKQHARLLLPYQIGGATMGVDHVGTM